jgi:hypothetical protein
VEARARTRQYVKDQRKTTNSFRTGMTVATMTLEIAATEFVDAASTRFA